MKNVFVVNPCAGSGKWCKKTIEFIKESCVLIGADFDIYTTKSIGDATEFVKTYIINNGNARFIACGGDGSLSEVINGVIGFSGSEVGVMPNGTGNDFCRNFATNASYRDAISQIYGKAVKCDAIKYTYFLNGNKYTKYCANMINIGFDCNVADMTAQMKMKPFISGSMAYYVSILSKLLKKDGASLKITIDGKEEHLGNLLLTSIANGSYCGGGIMSNPLADLSDGILDVNIVNDVSRIKFLKLLPHYIKGDFLQLKNIGDVVRTFKCKKITVEPLDGTMRICNDGEIFDAGKTEFEVVPEAFNFVVPGVNSETKIKEKVF